MATLRTHKHGKRYTSKILASSEMTTSFSWNDTFFNVCISVRHEQEYPAPNIDHDLQLDAAEVRNLVQHIMGGKPDTTSDKLATLQADLRGIVNA